MGKFLDALYKTFSGKQNGRNRTKNQRGRTSDMSPPLSSRRQTSKDSKSSQRIPSSNNSAPAVNRTVVKENEDRLRKLSSSSISNQSSSQCSPETSSAFFKTVSRSVSQDSSQNCSSKSSIENNRPNLFSALFRKTKQSSDSNTTGNKQKRGSSEKSKSSLRTKKTLSDEDLRYRKSRPLCEDNRQIRGPPSNYERRRTNKETNELKPKYRRSYSSDDSNNLLVSNDNFNIQKRLVGLQIKSSASSNLPCHDLSSVPECVHVDNYMVKSVPEDTRSVRASKAAPTHGNTRTNALKVASSGTSRGVRVSKSSPEVTRKARVTKPNVGGSKIVAKNSTKVKSNVIRGLFGSEDLNNKALKNNVAVVVALNHNNNIVLTPTSSKRTDLPDSSNITIRRGQTQGASASKTSNGNALRGASSVTSLDSKHKVAPLNTGKLVKASSKEKLDKPTVPLVPPQKNERSKNESKSNKANNIAAALKNNNRIDLKEPIITNGDTKVKEVIGPTSLPGTLEASNAELAMQELVSVQKELEVVTREKASLVSELSSYQGELQSLRSELTRLQSYQDQHSTEMEHLSEENAILRSRLMEVAHSPLSDNEKQQLLLDTQRQHNSAPASFSTNEMGDISTSHLNGGMQPNGEMTSSCPTPDWDKHSSSSLSEVSVACLQDRILQMEETHYSTNEELQATLQELADLQTQLLELQVDNERLRDEKTVLLESLCQQTEKLEDSRAAVGTLRELLIRSGGGGSQPEDAALDDAQIREQKLVDLLKAAQEEKEALLSKHEELMNELHTLRQSATAQAEEREQLVDRVRLLETTVDSVHAERKLIDEELAKAKEQSSARRIEISQLSTLLDNARSKIDELEKERDKGDRSEMDALLDLARKEKDTLESQVAELQGEVSRGQCEKERLKEQLSTLQEECKVAKNNAKTVISDIEYQLSEAKREISNLKAELQTSHNALLEVQAQVQRHLEDKRGLKAVLAETQRSLADVERRLTETKEKLHEEEDRREKENEEWEQFRRDLLMTVRVANDFKTEAQSEREKLLLENKMLKERARALETQLEKLKAVKTPSPTLIRQSSVPVETQNSLLSSVQEMAARRQKVGSVRQDSQLSVKSLIESIENATKQVKAGPGGSHNSSTSSLNSIASDIRTPSIAPSNGGNLSVPVSTGNGDWNERTAKSPLREQQQSVTPIVNKTQRSPSNKNLITDVGYGNKTDTKPEDTIRESVAILSAKSIDFVRRNSYGDLSERKDPLNGLVKNGGSKRNALLKWCQQKTVGYRNIDITNFSSSWNDGLALCALLHTYLPDRIPYDTLVPTEKRRNFSLAFAAAESVGIPTTLNINDMCQLERPDWQQVMAYVTAIYKHFET